jgi:hypothetical protein
VDRARDLGTGDLVWASDATTHRPYRCPNCRQRVNVVRASLEFKRSCHFAHAIGVASPDCELYFAPTVRYSGRAAVYDTELELVRLKHEHLELTLGPRGPLLALCLPPVNDKGWIGSLLFSSSRVSRRVTFNALKYGQRIEFPLFDGLWTLVPEGIVAAEYLECVQLGSQSLESGANLFYVERGNGRRVLPAESISCGESIRWLSRQSFYLPVELADVVRVECEYQENGWTLNRLSIASQLDVGQMRILTEWLQRRVIERRVRVWIDTPWAQGSTPQGLWIYPAGVTLTLCAGHSVDMQVRSLTTSRVLGEVKESIRLEFVSGEEGVIEVLVNDAHYEFFHIGSALHSINAMVRFAGADFTDISNAQRSLDAVIAEGRGRCPVLVTVGHAELFELVETSGTSAEHHELILKAELRPGSSLRLDRLGELHWPAPVVSEQPAKESSTRGRSPIALIHRARWLRSISSSTNNPASTRLRLPKELADDLNFAPLARLSWSVRWRAHVHQLQRDLDTLYS